MAPLEQTVLPTQTEDHEKDIANMYNGTITLVAVVRCGANCGKSLNVYPGIGQTMTRGMAAKSIVEHSWKKKNYEGEPMWLCPDCAAKPRTKMKKSQESPTHEESQENASI